MPDNYPVLKPGDTGDAVKDMQRKLEARGLTLKITSVFDERTQSALNTYQRGRKMTESGQCGPETWAALNKPRSD